MNIRQAILRAADHIERNPGEFKYSTNDRPGCGTPGCMLGWTGVFLGVKATEYDGLFACNVAEAIGTSLGEFINRARTIREAGRLWYSDFEPREVASANAANVLRLYADRYHPAESRELIPASVRAIFTMTPDQIRSEFQRESA